MKTAIIANCYSSKLKKPGVWDTIREQLIKAVDGAEVFLTDEYGDAKKPTAIALKNGFERIIAVGGDGTLGEAAGGFFEGSEPINPAAAFSFLMCGAGNDFQKTFGRKPDLRSALNAIANPREKMIDVGKIDHDDFDGNRVSRIFLNLASFGMSGLVDRKVNEFPAKPILGGKLSFMFVSATTLFAYRNQFITLEVDGKTVFEGKMRLVVTANGRYAGGGMLFAPGAEIDDGKLDIVILGDVGSGEAIWNMPKLYAGNHLDSERVYFFRGSKIEAKGEGDVLLDIDGEAPGKLPAVIETIPKGLRLLY